MKTLRVIVENGDVDELGIYEYHSKNTMDDIINIVIKNNDKIHYTSFINILNIINNLPDIDKTYFPILKYEDEPLKKDVVHKLIESLLYNHNVVFFVVKK